MFEPLINLSSTKTSPFSSLSSRIGEPTLYAIEYLKIFKHILENKSSNNISIFIHEDKIRYEKHTFPISIFDDIVIIFKISDVNGVVYELKCYQLNNVKNFSIEYKNFYNNLMMLIEDCTGMKISEFTNGKYNYV